MICAPFGRDAELMASILCREGIEAVAFQDFGEMCAEIAKGAAAILLTEEALNKQATDQLCTTLQVQEPWSDLPMIVLTSAGEVGADRTWLALKSLEPAANASLLERPVRSMTLLSAVQVALRSRRRQYEVRAMQQELESRVTERTCELRRLMQEAEGFSYTISHDLRAPLRTIVASSEILMEDFGHLLPTEAQEELTRQSRAASNLAQLIDDLLRLSRLGREAMQPTDLDLSRLAEEAIRDIPEEHLARCQIDIERGLTAHGDPLLLKLVLQNLIGNACKFSPKGGRIRVGQEEDGSFFVRDEGIGFQQKYAHKMFLPFERLVTNAEFPGTGIGLANVQRIIERHGGKVWAESEGVGHGAKFSFSLR